MKQRGRTPQARKRAAKLKKKRRQMLFIGAAVLVIALLVFLTYYFSIRSRVNKIPKNVICNNVFIDDIDVSGMNAKEAKKAVQKKIDTYKKTKVTLVAEEAKVDVTLDELGFSMSNLDQQIKAALSYGKSGSIWSRNSAIKELEKNKKVLSAVYAVDEKAVTKVIDEKMPELEGSAKDATLTRKDGVFVITDSRKGVAIDIESSVQVIETYFNKTWSKKDGTIELVVKVEEPKVTREDFEQVKDLLGTFTTYCGTGGGRVQNIVSGASHINGAVIMPGETYSANAAMEPYTKENGFAEAGSYENGKVVQSMGGGICQVSSTLYNAVILSELEIVERAAHSMLVNYVKPSMDAAIAGDFKDLKFKNNTDAPIYIEGFVKNGNITFNVFGKETRDSSRKVSYEHEVLSQTPASKKFVATADPVGTKKMSSSGHTGMKARLWKVVTENGQEVSRTIVNNSTYRSSEEIWNVGTASADPAITAAINAAIATQDEAKINEAIAKAQSTTPPAGDEGGAGDGSSAEGNGTGN